LCRVHKFEDELRELVEDVEWYSVLVEDPGSDSDSSSNDLRLGTRTHFGKVEFFEPPFDPSDTDACEKYYNYIAE